MKREYRLTSKLGELHIAPHRESHKEKIIHGLEKLRVGGTHEMIADMSGLRADQCWKRLSELVKDGKVFDTGLLKPLKSGVPGIVWQLKDIRPAPSLVTVFSLPDESPTNPSLIQQSLF